MSILAVIALAYLTCVVGAGAVAVCIWSTMSLVAYFNRDPAKLPEAKRLLEQGAALIPKGRLDEARKNLEDAARLARQAGAPGLQAVCLRELASIRLAQGEPGQARELLAEGLKLARAADAKDLMPALLGGMGMAWRSIGDSGQALKHFEQALVSARVLGDERSAADQLGNIGLIYRTEGNLDRAVELHREALAIDQRIGHLQGVSEDLDHLGLAYFAKGELADALAYHERSLETARAANHRRVEASSLGNIGIVLQAMGQPEKALTFHEEALTVARQLGDRRFVANQLASIGCLLLSKGEPAQSLPYLREAERVFAQIGAQDQLQAVRAMVETATGRQGGEGSPRFLEEGQSQGELGAHLQPPTNAEMGKASPNGPNEQANAAATDQLLAMLAGRKDWRDVPAETLRPILDDAKGDEETLHCFLTASEDSDMVRRFFVPYCRDPREGKDMARYMFAFALYRVGSQLTKRYLAVPDRRAAADVGMLAEKAFRGSILCFRYYFASYYGVAALLAEIGQRDLALDWCRKYHDAKRDLVSKSEENLRVDERLDYEMLDPERASEYVSHVPPGVWRAAGIDAPSTGPRPSYDEMFAVLEQSLRSVQHS